MFCRWLSVYNVCETFCRLFFKLVFRHSVYGLSFARFCFVFSGRECANSVVDKYDMGTRLGTYREKYKFDTTC